MTRSPDSPESDSLRIENISPWEVKSILDISRDSENGCTWVSWQAGYGLTLDPNLQRTKDAVGKIFELNILSSWAEEIVARVAFRVVSHVDLGIGFENKPGHHLMVQAQVFSWFLSPTETY